MLGAIIMLQRAGTTEPPTVRGATNVLESVCERVLVFGGEASDAAEAVDADTNTHDKVSCLILLPYPYVWTGFGLLHTTPELF